MARKKKDSTPSDQISQERNDSHVKSVYEGLTFDLDSSAVKSEDEEDQIELSIYKEMLKESNQRLFILESFLLDRGLMEHANLHFISDEEMICVQGIEYIKRLVLHGTFTKDDINAFDVLHRNLCLIRGISIDRKKNKKETPKNREDLLKLIKEK